MYCRPQGSFSFLLFFPISLRIDGAFLFCSRWIYADLTNTSQASDLIPPGSSTGSIAFQVTLTNWRGKSSSSTIQVEIRQQPVPQLTILGGEYQSVPKNKPLVINTQIGASACVKQFTAVTSWVATCSSLLIQDAWSSNPSILKSGLKLTIPAYSLPLNIQPNPWCKFTVAVIQTAFSDDASKVLLTPVTVTHNVTVVFTESSPVAVIDQGSRVDSPSRDLYFSALGSYDPDVSSGSQSGQLLYCWSCTKADGSMCVNWTSLAIGWNNISIGKDLLSPSSQYQITLTVGRNDGSLLDPSVLAKGTCSQIVGLNSSSTVQITTAAAGQDPPEAIIVPLSLPKVSVSDTLRLSGSIFANAAHPSITVRYGWSITPSPPNLLQYNRTALDGIASGPVALVIAPGMLEGNQRYKIQLTATYNSMSSQAFFEVLTNNPPESGMFTISPSSGQALLTLFTLSAISWMDQDLPISTVFGFRDQSTRNDVMLGSPGLLSSISTPLPQGDVNGQLQIFCIVSDALGSARRVGCGGDPFCSVPITNFPSSTSCSVLQQTYNARMQQLTSIGDTSAILAYAGIMGKALKSLSSSLGPCPGSSWAAITSTIMQDVMSQVSAASTTSSPGGIMDPQARDLTASSLVAALPDSASITPQMLAQILSVAGTLLSGNLPPLSDATVSSLSKVLDKVTSSFISQSLKTASAFRRQGLLNGQQTAQNIFDWYTNLAVGGMRNKSPGEVLVGSNGSVVYTVKRFAKNSDPAAPSSILNYYCLDSQSPSLCNSWDADRYVTVPASLFQNLQGQSAPASSIDVLVVDLGTNPYSYAGNWSTVFGEIVRLQVLSDSGSSGADSVLTFSGISSPISIRISVRSAPTSNRNPITGRYKAAGCSSWLDLSASGQSSSTWGLRAGLSTQQSFTFAQNPDPVPSLPAPGFATCLLSQSAAESLSITRFGIVRPHI